MADNKIDPVLAAMAKRIEDALREARAGRLQYDPEYVSQHGAASSKRDGALKKRTNG